MPSSARRLAAGLEPAENQLIRPVPQGGAGPTNCEAAMQHHPEQPGVPARVVPATGLAGEPARCRTGPGPPGGDSAP